jgi:phosphoribosylformimino-5-aminoimidazole carboxamide ribonucleotide (ProFAR) isomerase
VQLYPALDIRLGQLARSTPAADPVAAAQAFAEAGARWMHVVDMDRAVGEGRNDALIRQLAAVPGVGIQLGGGLTDPADVAEALEWGVRRVVLGAAAIAGLATITQQIDPLRLAVALDASGAEPASALPDILATGVRHVVYRNLDRDGSLRGADVDGARELVGHEVRIILAGGVAFLDELRAARRAGIAGVIVGRALHEGRFSIAEALACCG